ncbi:MAG: hypothetical protein KJ630_01185 [Proteobacteria bacterium]|nr:hypothetical protein [Pseudomonadota bacterium]
METAPFSFMGTSDVYIDVLTDQGVATGLQLKGNCREFTIKGDSERVEQIGSNRSNFGHVIASVTIAKPASAAFVLDQMDPDMFAMAFFGTTSALTQSSASVTDQEVVANHDKWVELGKYMISTVVVTHISDTPTYVLGTDYEINTRLGMIKVLSTGSIVDAATIQVSYAHAAVAGSQMTGMTKTNVRLRMVLDGENYADGRNFKLDVYSARLAPSGEFGFQAGDNKFMEAKFEASLETPSGRTEPFKLFWLS